MGLHHRPSNSKQEIVEQYVDRLPKDAIATGLFWWVTNFPNIDWDLPRAKGLDRAEFKVA